MKLALRFPILMKYPLLVSLAATAFLSGCAGYNTTMFMTKSNAGLDLDMKPPTAEINISRKEAVIEPAFEGGKTPPVMASFKPSTGFGGGFKNYFVGVNQTFAGGDAAQTMAKLYDAPTFIEGDEGMFDSTLTLLTPINGSTKVCDPLVIPAAPGKIRPFIFGTDTSLGLKVAWSGAGGQFPDTVKAGFNRKEFAWAPISMSTDHKSVKMPSFLATIQSKISGGMDATASAMTNGMNQAAGIEAIQYFATGESASLLARQKDVRDAMLARLDPAYHSKRTPHNPYILRNMLFAMVSTFQGLSSQDPIAAGFIKRLADLHGIDVPNSFQSAKPALFYYTFTPAAGGGSALIKKATAQAVPGMPSANLNVGLVNAYIALLQNSLDNLALAQAQLASGTPLQFQTDAGVAAAITPKDSMELQKQLDLQALQIQLMTQQVSANEDILAAYDYFNRLTKQ